MGLLIFDNYPGIMLIWVVALFLLYLLQSSWFNGFAGELLVDMSLNIHLDKDAYRLQKDVVLPVDDGNVSIGRIIVSEYGVFVIETQNMRGWIFGNTNLRAWTQKLWRYAREFRNPLERNRRHVETLKSVLELSDNQIFSVVVFVGSSAFKTDMPENVIHGRDLVRYIKSKKRQAILSSDVPMILSTIEAERLVPSTEAPAASEAPEQTRERVAQKETGQFCPQCDSPIVRRERINGLDGSYKFVGCSRFPECRGAVLISVADEHIPPKKDMEPAFTDSWGDRSWRDDEIQTAFTDRAFG